MRCRRCYVGKIRIGDLDRERTTSIFRILVGMLPTCSLSWGFVSKRELQKRKADKAHKQAKKHALFCTGISVHENRKQLQENSYTLVLFSLFQFSRFSTSPSFSYARYTLQPCPLPPSSMLNLPLLPVSLIVPQSNESGGAPTLLNKQTPFLNPKNGVHQPAASNA